MITKPWPSTAEPSNGGRRRRRKKKGNRSYIKQKQKDFGHIFGSEGAVTVYRKTIYVNPIL